MIADAGYCGAVKWGHMIGMVIFSFGMSDVGESGLMISSSGVPDEEEAEKEVWR